jgi:hypothetical protein
MNNCVGHVFTHGERVAELEQQVADLRLAVDTRQRIGVSIGLLAARLHCDADQAWEFLAWLSQHTNTKARVVAQVLLDMHCRTVAPDDEELAETVRRLLPQLSRPAVPPPNSTALKGTDALTCTETQAASGAMVRPVRMAVAIPDDTATLRASSQPSFGS